MQTTQKRQEDDVKVRRATGPLHFIDANQPAGIPSQQMVHGAFETPLAQGLQFAALPTHLAYGPQAVYGVPPVQWAQPMQPAFAPNPGATVGMAYPRPQMANVPQGVAQRVPACDIVDEGSEYVCQVELPGVKRENVDVSCFERALLITAHAEPDIDVGALVLSERGSTASFRRAITLPSDIQTGEAKATLRDGILTINLPKARPTAGPKRIPVA